MFKYNGNKSPEFPSSPGKTPESSPRVIEWTPRNLNTNPEPCLEESSNKEFPSKINKNTTDNLKEKDKKVCIKIHSTSSVSSESSLVDASPTKVNIKKNDDCQQVKRPEQREKTKVINEKIGFSESSSLSVLNSCVDDPSIFCNCKKKPSDLSTNLEKNVAYCSSCDNETVPNQPPNVKVISEHQYYQSRQNSEANMSVNSSQVESDSDALSFHGKRFTSVEGRKVVFVNYPCKHEVPSQNLGVLPRNMVSHEQDFRAHGEPIRMNYEPQPQQTMYTKKKFITLKSIFTKQKNITIDDQHNHSQKQHYQRTGTQQNPTRSDAHANYGTWYENILPEHSQQKVIYCCPHPKHKGDACCCSLELKQSDNTLPGLFAAKVNVGSEDMPKRFVFNAVNYEALNEFQNPQEPETYMHERKRKKLNPKSPQKTAQQNQRFTSIYESGLPDIYSTDQVIVKEIDDKHKKSPPDDENYGNIGKLSSQPERIEIYYFDHGSAGYYRTTDDPPPLLTDKLVENLDSSASKFWAQMFGIFHIITAFIISFLLQLLRFLMYGIIRPLLIGIIQITSDYLFKPLLAILFNAVLQPILILLYNVVSSLKDILELVAQAFGFFLQEIANVCQSIRLVDIKNNARNGPYITPNKDSMEI